MAEALTPHLPGLLWWVPLLPLLAAAVIAVLPDARGKAAARIAIVALTGSCLIAIAALLCSIPNPSPGSPIVASALPWFSFGESQLRVGLLLDPMSAAMAAMVTFVALWIFIYSSSYMQDDRRFGRFFGFLSLFCGAMLLAVLSNSLLLLFMAWELVGLASYLLIGFHYERPAAAAAAQKAFITTRVGDIAFFVGMIWLQGHCGTLMFFDSGNGLLESGALSSLAATTTIAGLSVSAAASLLLLIGAMGKSGQVPLHAWLPDAMEGPTPVSALIHAATMVAAGVFLIARTHPVFAAAADPQGLSIALSATAWIGAVTAIYAALVAMAQSDIKRILAYSTVSQLGFMMVALGTGGVAAAMLHLIAHAFFKALLFLTAGSVIHGCHGDQDIRRMGGLRGRMPLTFATYAIGMMALAGFPFVFSGFWSKEAILHSAKTWPGGIGPFLLAATAALLTAFYMTRQAILVFFGTARADAARHAHESPRLILVPLMVLAAGAVLLAIVATPAWPAFERWIDGESAEVDFSALVKPGSLFLIGLSVVLVAAGVGLAWKIYQKTGSSDGRDLTDPVELRIGRAWGFLESGMGFDSFYQKTLIAPLAFVASGIDLLERQVFVRLTTLAGNVMKRGGTVTHATDEHAINRGFDAACTRLRDGASANSRSQSGRPQGYLRPIGLAAVVLILLYLWLKQA